MFDVLSINQAIMSDKYMIVECPWPDRGLEGGNSLSPVMLAHLSIPLITVRGIGTATCVIGNVFPPDDPWIGLDTYTICALVYFQNSDWWGVPLVFIYKEIFNWMEKGWSMVAGPFPEMAVLYRMLSISISYEMSYVWAMVSTFVYLPRFFCPPTFGKMDWSSCHGPPLYHIYILNFG